jgi:hypothetical protein
VKNEEIVFSFYFHSCLRAFRVFNLLKKRPGMRTKGNHRLGHFRGGALAVVNNCNIQKEKVLFLFLFSRADNRSHYHTSYNVKETGMGEVC